MKKILWIEDDAFNELGFLATPVHLTGEFELQYAMSATEGADMLRRQEYDAVVVDIRIPPGDDPRWIDLYYKTGSDKKASQLGLRLLQKVLGRDAEWTRDLPAPAKEPGRYGVLSMDANDVRRELEPLGVRYYHNKNEGTRVLLTTIREILQALETKTDAAR